MEKILKKSSSILSVLSFVMGGTLASGAAYAANPPRAPYTTDALIYDGVAAAYGDADSLASVLESEGMTYKVVSSEELSAMSVDQLSRYGVIIWPGGYATQMSESLTPEARMNIRQAVREKGVSFIGFCAGAFIAVAPAPSDGKAPEWGFSLVDGAQLEYFYPKGPDVEADMTKVTFPDGSSRDLVWWGGPFIPNGPNWSGGIVARYPDGSAAIGQTWAGNGFVTLSGPHPEAPEDWRTKLGLADDDGLDLELAGKLIDAALHQTRLASF